MTPPQKNPHSAAFFLPRFTALALLAAGLCGCQTSLLKRFSRASPDPVEAVPEAGDGQNMADRRARAYELLKMPFPTVAKNSITNFTMPPNIRVACAKVEVLEKDAKGKPKRAMALGQVFVDLNFGIPLRGLADDAVITPTSVEFRGHAAVKRGMSVIVAKNENTVIRVDGENIQIEGEHEALKEDEMLFGEQATLKPKSSWYRRIFR